MSRPFLKYKEEIIDAVNQIKTETIAQIKARMEANSQKTIAQIKVMMEAKDENQELWDELFGIIRFRIMTKTLLWNN